MHQDILSDLIEKPQPISIEESYKALTKSAFALWIRLMVVPASDLKLGRCHVTRCLEGHKRSQFNAVLRELTDKGYVKLIKSRGTPTKIVPLLAPMLMPPNRFINFS